MPTLETIRRLTIQARSEGTDQAAASLNKVADAQQRVAQTSEVTAVATERSARRQLSAAGSYDRLLRSVDESYRAQQQFARGQNVIDRAFQQGVIDVNEQARAMDLLRQRYTAVGAANDNFGKASVRSAGLARQ